MRPWTPWWRCGASRALAAFPVEEYSKFPDCWEGVVHLAPVLDDPPAVVARLSAKLAAGGWVLEDHTSDAIAVWDRRNTALVHPWHRARPSRRGVGARQGVSSSHS